MFEHISSNYLQQKTLVSLSHPTSFYCICSFLSFVCFRCYIQNYFFIPSIFPLADMEVTTLTLIGFASANCSFIIFLMISWAITLYSLVVSMVIPKAAITQVISSSVNSISISFISKMLHCEKFVFSYILICIDFL